MQPCHFAHSNPLFYPRLHLLPMRLPAWLSCKAQLYMTERGGVYLHVFD